MEEPQRHILGAGLEMSLLENACESGPNLLPVYMKYEV